VGSMGIGTAAAILLTASLSLSGCATGRTGTHVVPRPEDVSRVKNVGLYVKVERGFAVRLQYVSNADRVFLGDLICLGLGAHRGARLAGADADTAVGVGMGVGVAAAVAGEFSPDKRATRAMKSEAAQLDSARAIGRALLDIFQTTNVFPSIELMPSGSPTTAGEGGKDTILVVTVRRWGLRPPLGSTYDSGDKAAAQLELDVNLTLVSCTTGDVLWERDEFYLDDEFHSLGDFKSQAGLLVSRMEHALRSVCDTTAREVYPWRRDKEAIP
jgi:hypothetical protein